MNDASQPGNAAVDHARRAVTVPRRLMPAVLALYAGDPIQDHAAVDELESAGVIGGNHLDEMVATLIDIMTGPELVITADIVGSDIHRLVTFWATATRAAVGTTFDQSQFELMQIEPSLLAFHLAQALGVNPRPALPFTGSCSLPSTALRSARALATREKRHAAAVLRGTGAPFEWAERVAEALARQERLWTAESVWLRRGSANTQSRLEVLDAGEAGYWRLIERPAKGLVSLQIVEFDDLLQLLLSLLPGHCRR